MPSVFGLVSIKAATSSLILVLRSSISTVPLSLDLTSTIWKPPIDALAGLVP